jgi:hypothetical protein
MKILVKNIESNPYRGIKKYPIDRSKIEALKISIKNTSFWDNIIVRQHPTKKGKYQLAYGHHRFVALKEIGIKEINVPVRKLDDAMMIRIMAEENSGWSHAPAIMIQTIDSVRKFLDAELKKCKTYKDLGRVNLPNLFESEPEFRSVKGNGVGKGTIAKFLGGNWNEAKVRGALEVLDDDEFDKEIIDIVDNMYQIGEFRIALKKNSVPMAKQKRMVTEIVKKQAENKVAKIPSGGKTICTAVFEKVNPPKVEKQKPKDPDLKKAENLIEEIRMLSVRLRSAIGLLYLLMKKMKVQEVRGLNTIIAGCALKKLIGLIQKVSESENKVDERHQLITNSK